MHAYIILYLILSSNYVYDTDNKKNFFFSIHIFHVLYTQFRSQPFKKHNFPSIYCTNYLHFHHWFFFEGSFKNRFVFLFVIMICIQQGSSTLLGKD